MPVIQTRYISKAVPLNMSSFYYTKNVVRQMITIKK